MRPGNDDLEALDGPLSVHGASKLAGEAAIRDVGAPHLIIRTSWVYAPAGSNFLRIIVRRAKEREELRIVADQIGAPTSAAIISDAVAALFERSEGLKWLFARTDGLVHLAASGTTSFHGFATAIVDGLRAHGMPLKAARVVPITTADYPIRAHRSLNSRLDLSRLSDALGVSTPLRPEGLNTALRSMIASS